MPKHSRPGHIVLAMLAAWLNREQEKQIAYLCEEVRAFRESFDEPLEPAGLVQYRRIAWQPPDDDLRVTLDQNLKVYARDLLSDGFNALSLMAATPIHVEPDAILEVKSSASWPDWLSALTDRHGLVPSTYSKFLIASHAAQLHGSDTAS